MTANHGWAVLRVRISVLYFILISTPLFSQPAEDLYLKILRKADSLRTLNKLSEAEIVYRQVLVFNDKSVEAYMGLGKIAYARLDWPKVREHFSHVIKLAPDDIEAEEYLKSKSKVYDYVVIGDSLRLANSLKAAEKQYEKALNLDDDYPGAYKGLGKIAYLRNDWGNFNKYFNKALEQNPGDKEILDLFKNNPRYFQILNEAAELFSKRDYLAAKRLNEEALKINKHSIQAIRNLGRIAIQTKDWGEAKDRYMKIIESDLPDDLEANCGLGIAYRETGKFKSLLLKKIEFDKSREYFEKTIELDSTYSDVLYQRGLLEKLKENWFEAIKWGHRQIQVNRGIPHANVGLFKFYKLLLVHESREKVQALLKKYPGNWSEYIHAEELRRQNENTKAEQFYLKLLSDEVDFNKIPVYLSLARCYVDSDQHEKANGYFNLALQSLATETDAEFLFDFSKFVFSDYELETYLNLTEINHKKIFYQNFWTYRDPTPASPVNERVIEHIRRLNYAEKNYWFDGVRSWANNPDKAGQLTFPQVYEFNEEFNDKGLVYLRYGEPDNVAVTPNRTITNESWLYNSWGSRPKMMFHFIIDEKVGVGSNWQIIPIVADSTFLRDRLGWDTKINRLYLAMTQTGRDQKLVEINSIESQITDESRQIVKHAFANDSHTWDEEKRSLSFAYYVANLRGFGNKTHLEVYCGIPVSELKKDNSNGQNRIIFEQGAGVFDRAWHRVTRSFEKVDVNINDSSRVFNNLFLQKYDFYLTPGVYNLSLYAKDDSESKIGAINLKTQVPTFDKDKLSLSDPIPAYDIQPGAIATGFDKGDLALIPNPSGEFLLEEPLFLYYEIYNLKSDKEKDTRYKIETEMALEKRKRSGMGKIFEFLGSGDKNSIAITHEREGRKTDGIEFGSFDVSNLSRGDYKLTVKIEDMVSGQIVAKTLAITLK